MWGHKIGTKRQYFSTIPVNDTAKKTVADFCDGVEKELNSGYSAEFRDQAVMLNFKRKHDELTNDENKELKEIEELTLKLEKAKNQYRQTRFAILELEHAHRSLADEYEQAKITSYDCEDCKRGQCSNFWHPEEGDGQYKNRIESQHHFY